MHLYAKIQKSAQICKCICRYAIAYNPLSNNNYCQVVITTCQLINYMQEKLNRHVIRCNHR